MIIDSMGLYGIVYLVSNKMSNNTSTLILMIKKYLIILK